jgi:hypothetical protein
MPRITVLAVVFFFAILSGCSEKPPRGDPEGGHAYNQPPQSPLHERTLQQGESERIGN